jgi:hypothetical protein
MVGPKLEDTIDSYLVGVVACLAMLACLAGLRDHAIRLMKRRRQHGLRTCCDGQRTNVSAAATQTNSLVATLCRSKSQVVVSSGRSGTRPGALSVPPC